MVDFYRKEYYEPDNLKKIAKAVSQQSSNEINGEPSLIEDPAEAYEVAHATRHLEERHRRALGHYAHNKVDSLGVIPTRVEADKEGKRVSEEYRKAS